MSCGSINDVSAIIFCNDTAIVNEGSNNLTISGDLILKGNTQTGNSGQITLNCEDNTHGVKIKAPPHNPGASYTLTLPNTIGTNGQFLRTDGTGVLSFADVSGSSSGGSLITMAKSFLGFAKGGAVSKGQPVVVGERGAEVFVPNSTGQITQAARGTSSGQTTVNFNINTLDASGFDDLLVRNRGTITQIINNAVNDRGSRNLI